jgi:hypothetical protein
VPAAVFALPYAGAQVLIDTIKKDFSGNLAQLAGTVEEIRDRRAAVLAEGLRGCASGRPCIYHRNRRRSALCRLLIAGE